MLADADSTQLPMFSGADDDEIDDDPVVRRVVDANQAPAPDLGAKVPRSVFDLAEIGRQFRLRTRFGDAAGFQTQPVKATIEREPGVTKHVGAAYPVRWTEQDHEKERQRRARQKPPKPTKKAKRHSRKLLDMIGDDIYDD